MFFKERTINTPHKNILAIALINLCQHWTIYVKIYITYMYIYSYYNIYIYIYMYIYIYILNTV